MTSDKNLDKVYDFSSILFLKLKSLKAYELYNFCFACSQTSLDSAQLDWLSWISEVGLTLLSINDLHLALAKVWQVHIQEEDGYTKKIELS